MLSPWKDTKRKLKEYKLLRRYHEIWYSIPEPGVESAFQSPTTNPRDEQLLIDSCKVHLGVPAAAGVFFLCALRLRRSSLIGNKQVSMLRGWAIDGAGSVGATCFACWTTFQCGYLRQKLTKALSLHDNSKHALEPGLSEFTDLSCRHIIPAMEQLRQERGTDLDLLTDPKLGSLREVLDMERQCKLRVAYQKLLQRELACRQIIQIMEQLRQERGSYLDLLTDPKLRSLQELLDMERQCTLRVAYEKQLLSERGIADGSPLLPVRIPFPGVPDDDRLLLLDDGSDNDNDNKGSSSSWADKGDQHE